MKPDQTGTLQSTVKGDIIERIQQHSRYLYHFAYRLTGNPEDAEDLTQETMWQAHRKSDKFVYEKSLKAWLRTMMTNLFLDQKRKKSLKLVALEDALVGGENVVMSPLTPPAQSVEEQVEQRMLFETIKKEIENLPEIYRRVITLRHFHGLSYNEISEQLHIPVGTVKTQLFRARKLLKDRLT